MMRESKCFCVSLLLVHCELNTVHRSPLLSGLCTHGLHLTKVKSKAATNKRLAEEAL